MHIPFFCLFICIQSVLSINETYQLKRGSSIGIGLRTSYTDFEPNHGISEFESIVYSNESRLKNFITTDNKYIIKNREIPIVYKNRNYYWDNEYQPDTWKWKCQYRINDNDHLEITKVQYSNGSLPNSLFFGCSLYESCCGITCCNDMIYIVPCLVLTVVFISYIYCEPCLTGTYKRVRQL